MNDLTKNILVFIVIIVVLLSVVQGLSGVNGGQPQSTDYSEFLDQVRSGQVKVAEIEDERIRFGNDDTAVLHDQSGDRQQHADRPAR